MKTNYGGDPWNLLRDPWGIMFTNLVWGWISLVLQEFHHNEKYWANVGEKQQLQEMSRDHQFIVKETWMCEPNFKAIHDITVVALYCLPYEDLSSGTINRKPWELWIIARKKCANLFTEIKGEIINKRREDLLVALEEKS